MIVTNKINNKNLRAAYEVWKTKYHYDVIPPIVDKLAPYNKSFQKPDEELLKLVRHFDFLQDSNLQDIFKRVFNNNVLVKLTDGKVKKPKELLEEKQIDLYSDMVKGQLNPVISEIYLFKPRRSVNYTIKFLENFFLPLRFARKLIVSVKNKVLSVLGKADLQKKAVKEILADLNKNHIQVDIGNPKHQHYIKEIIKRDLAKRKDAEKLKLDDLDLDEKILKAIADARHAKNKYDALYALRMLEVIKKETKNLEKLGLTEKDSRFYTEITSSLTKRMNDTFNTNTTDYDATKLSNINKILLTLATSVFLVFDAYNLTMMEGDGNYKLAVVKAKERFVQEISRLLFSAWFVTGSNRMFSEFYNSSLKGLFAVTASNVSTYEFTARNVVGMPVGFKTQAEMKQMQREIDNKKGLSGAFLRLMGRLTGKKSIAEAAMLRSEQLKSSSHNTFSNQHIPAIQAQPKFSNNTKSHSAMPVQSNNNVSGTSTGFVKQRLNLQG